MLQRQFIFICMTVNVVICLIRVEEILMSFVLSTFITRLLYWPYENCSRCYPIFLRHIIVLAKVRPHFHSKLFIQKY